MNTMFSSGDILESKEIGSNRGLFGLPPVLKVGKVFPPPYRGSDQYGYRILCIRNGKWTYWGHFTAKSIEERYKKSTLIDDLHLVNINASWWR